MYSFQKFLVEDHSQFIEGSPELKAILADFVQAVLVHKPDDVFSFAVDFFTPYSSKLSQEPSHLSHSFNSQ